MGPSFDTDTGSDALQSYLRAIARIPRLTLEEERELGRRVRDTGDQDALRRLVEGNLRFVVSYAKRYRGLGVPFLDLIHEGNLGLMEAARRFDPDRNVKFITYAVWWIRQAITHALSLQSRPISMPQKLPPGMAATGSRSDVSLNDRLRGGTDDDEGPELGEMLEATDAPVDEELMRQGMAERVRSALGELDAKEREVMALRFGLDRDGETRTLQEIGQTLDLSRERIRQIEARAKEKLRRSDRASELRSYLN
jgi:RNA polymerase primary sigma factor